MKNKYNDEVKCENEANEEEMEDGNRSRLMKKKDDPEIDKSFHENESCGGKKEVQNGNFIILGLYFFMNEN